LATHPHSHPKPSLRVTGNIPALPYKSRVRKPFGHGILVNLVNIYIIHRAVIPQSSNKRAKRSVSNQKKGSYKNSNMNCILNYDPIY